MKSCRLVLSLALWVGAASTAFAQMTWNLTFEDPNGTGFNEGGGAGTPGSVGDTRQQTLRAALTYLGTQFDARGTINITVRPSLTALGSNTLASAGPTLVGGNGFQNGVVFQRGTTNTAPNFAPPQPPDGTTEWNFATDITWNNTQNPPAAGQTDMYSVAVHEFTHAMGFLSLIQGPPPPQPPGQPDTFWGKGINTNALGSPDGYSQFDRFLRRGTGGAFLLTAGPAYRTNDTATARADLTSNDVFFDGPIARAANGGTPVKMFAPDPYQTGSSISHFDTATPALANAVMLPGIAAGVSRRTFTAQDLGVLIDAGWNTHVWSNVTGNWAGNEANATGSPWRNVLGQTSLSPVGSITPNVILQFGGSGGAAYTSTNNLPANPFQVMRLQLNSTATVANTIAGANPLRFGTSIGVQPQIQQNNSGAFNITEPITTTAANLELTGDGTGLVTLSGAIGGNGALTKSGLSTFVLSGNNTYAGGTTVSGGTLLINNPLLTSGTGSGAVTVAANGTLGGGNGGAAGVIAFNDSTQGFVSGAVTVQDTGTLAPGNSVGMLSATGAVSFNTGARMTIEVGSAVVRPTGVPQDLNSNDRFKSAGNIAFGLNLTVNVNGGGQTFNAGQTYDFYVGRAGGSVGALPGTVTFVPSNIAGVVASPANFTLSTVGNDVVVMFQPVPEPATVLAVFLGGTAAAGWWRRRRMAARRDAA